MFTPGFRACRYKPTSGRGEWPNPDPIGEVGGLNSYGFVKNGPVNRIDSYGMFDVPGSESLAIAARVTARALGAAVRATGDAAFNSSNGLDYFEGAAAYYLGEGRTVTVPFGRYDPGWGFLDFPSSGRAGLHPCMLRPGRYPIRNSSDPFNHYSLAKMFTTAGPGRVVYRLAGTLTVWTNGSRCKEWRFDGAMRVVPNMFNFNPLGKWWPGSSPRGFWRESITRIVNRTPGGESYLVVFQGERQISEGGKCQ